MNVVLSGYQIGQAIYTGTRTLVYRAQRESDARSVVIKFLRNAYPTFTELLQFRNQYTIAKNLNIPGIIRPESLEPCGNSYALVMADFGSISLREYTQTHDLELTEILLVALQLTEILHGLYQHRVIHKDLKPANILIHPETKQIQLIDFSIASLLPKETEEVKHPNVLEGTLAYLAPEQTGRMNRGIDYRSDFYALGVTIFELLGGELPFQSDDPMELVHCHIAKTAPNLCEIKPEIPQVIGQIVAKLMAKNAEDRYQSALGLKYDLEICLHRLKETGKIEAFEIGTRDLCDRFIIPEKLYGRETEVQQLLDAFERVSQGTSELMLVAGFSGIGKTAVVSEVHKPIVKQRGYFIKGKFDQFNRNIPFSAFAQALRDLMRQLMSESDEQLQAWKTQILAAVGDSGQVLIEVIPELEWLIGVQPPVPELSGTAAQNRFNLLFQKFIAVFTTAEHPLVLFLDDLQWADSASLGLMKLLVEDKGYLLLLGAYRDNEVSPVHPFMLTVDELVKTGATVKTITLSPLHIDRIDLMVADTLGCQPEIAQPLSKWVFQKTQGNPFFTVQFLTGLHQDGYITFDGNTGVWQCDLARVRSLSLTDNVVEFMADRLRKLPAETQTVLKFAACIGAQFDLHTLAIVSKQSSEDAAMLLWKALQEGLIIPNTEIYKFFMQSHSRSAADTVANPTYRFLHDRVQQAAYSLIPDDQKQTTHYQIGQLLLQQISPEAREDRIFEIVNQLNYGITLITQPTARQELSQLNLIACRKAKSSIAYRSAREYAAVALSLLGESAWENQYKMTLSLHELAAELAMLCGDFQEMEQYIETVIDRARSLLEQVNVYQTKIQARSSQNQPTEAVAIGIQILQQLGVNFPESPAPDSIQQSIQEINELIGDRDIEEFACLPAMKDANSIAAVEIASSILSAAYVSGSPLYSLLVSLSVKLSLQHGNIAVSAYSYACYSYIVCNFLPDVDLAVKFSQLALNVVSKLDAKAAKPEVLMLLGSSIVHRKSHIKETLPMLRDSYATALEVGKLECAAYNGQYFCMNSFWCGEPLATLEQDARSYYNGLVQLNHLTSANHCQLHWQSILNLLGLAENPALLSGSALQETEFLPPLRLANDLVGLYNFHLYKLMLGFLFGEIEPANNNAVECKSYLSAALGIVVEPPFYFYDSLVALALFSQGSGEISSALKRVAENQIKLQYLADYAPMNYQHKVDLVEAEKCRVAGQKTEAIELYDKAISLAKVNEYIQEEALANELAAKFYLDWGKEKVAAGYMQSAYYCYVKWGAKAKTDDLERRYPHLLRPILQQAAQSLTAIETLASLATPAYSLHSSSSHSSSSNSLNNTLDFATLLQVSQALSSTIQLDELLQTLTKTMLENSGADRCALMLCQDDKWQVRVIADLVQTTLQEVPLENNPNLPFRLIQYVKNTLETLVVDDRQTNVPGIVSDYLNQHQPKSVLCLPLLDRGNLAGILYLENRLTSGVFSRDRILVINFLCTQAAISLENARLYRKTQDYAQKLEQSQLQLVQSEKMSALGNLVAGVAHEINNPVGFISGNISEALASVRDITDVLQLYQDKFPNPGDEIEEKVAEVDLEYVLADVPKMLNSMQVGCDRIKGISTSLRTFSRADKDYKVSFNLHDGIDSTLLILKHRLKANEHRPEIKVITDYGNLPEIQCFPGQLNQVFMNILANAIDAIDEANAGRSFADIENNPNRIAIRTRVENNCVTIAIADNGSGMPESVKSRIFDHLFTTKAVSKGTGLGLTIARQIVVEKHGGAIAVNSTPETSTEFTIVLPI
ncbi:MAG: trifunctional serine/threonine-protein kinase/ATP-binding protein/sensor histidine kinase [Oscillatoriaceae cyanobacterium Prado104]|jgi:predicted ATPase/signal transduction histidine kinase|nr:trifunctional serine/threonine-protein kinase/ATP-binding protein/sensor histidine kinase [Oscillatoriaceae cyanobacterium Prado104]